MDPDDSLLAGENTDELDSLSSWTLLTPDVTPLPVPSILSRSVRPCIPSPFQVSQLQPLRQHHSIRPVPQRHRFSTVHLCHVQYIHPEIWSPLVLHQIFHCYRDQRQQKSSAVEPTVDVQPDSTSAGRPRLLKPGSAFSGRAAATAKLTRVRISSESPMVWKLWQRSIAEFHHFSTVIQQLQSSQFPDEYAARFLNQFAATTLVRYLSALMQFVQLCRDMHVSFESLSGSNLADLLICGALARRSDGSGPKSSVTIKAMRWACKHLGIHYFSCAFFSLVNSFEKQKIPADRKESLPFPLFILMKWERRILQSQASAKEIAILGGFLLLCWSGLRATCRGRHWRHGNSQMHH